MLIFSHNKVFFSVSAKNPVPVRCPVAGKFNFTQKGDVKFETRILGGVTQSPRPNIYCKENISDFSVCDTDQKEMQIDENYCLTVDHLGRPTDIYSKFHLYWNFWDLKDYYLNLLFFGMLFNIIIL